MPLYIAEINIPIACHMPIGNRCKIENPAEFGVKRGYWRIALRPDEIGNDKPSGIDIVLELTAESIKEAEDAVLDAGKSLSLFFSVFVGQPSVSPLLRRLAEVGPSKGIVEQRRYYYEDDWETMTTMPITPWVFSSFLRRVTNKCKKTRQLLEMAIRWYSIGLTANDPLDTYLAIWIGLEALCESLAERYHPDGYESCELCCEALRVTQCRRDNDAILAINHIVQRVAPELLENRSIVDLKNFRNFMAHPDRFIREEKGLDDVRREIRPLVQDMQQCLAVAILNLVNPPTESPGAVSLWSTPRLETHPYSMMRFRSDMELNDFEPWAGQWVDIKRNEGKVSSEIDKEGLYLPQTESKICFAIEERDPKPNIDLNYVIFERGRRINHKGSNVEHRLWRPITISAARKRMMDEEL